ncbi:SDR family oxidoreductase [Phenylobacterium sp.]|uniref:SDR family NAD(P)-dependent oxidoreductase n=1 Tax=Phenylobacterium sp. TaxID=1871053 RepID=UPI0027319144|nr:SDR family oxidoreductase [Phenylobacterium sp.]MDP1617970.1 SDR family oxidoreductase [Phenylobacterium sp.]MDP1988811.1 SDR family oxidoreductase [Phenylobacterium sp.]
MPALPSVLITGASSGIGATYADRFARRGHDLILVARDTARMDALAERLRDETGVSIEVTPADLTRSEDLEAVAARLRADERIGVLINNAGASLSGGFANQSMADVLKLIALNVSAVTGLANAVAPRFAQKGEGAIVNIGSVVGLAPEFGLSVYGATKAFVLFLSQGLALELGPKGVYVQAVLPAGTRTEIWSRSGVTPDNLPPLMEVGDLVDAALAGFDLREPITIPPLHNGGLWDDFHTARQAMLPGFGQIEPAARYRQTA